MVKTRTKKACKPAASQTDSSQASANQARTLAGSVTEPPQVCILPKNLTENARIITIPDLTDSSRTTRLLVCPEKGFYEFTNVADNKACRSWLLTPEHAAADSEAAQEDGYILRRPGLLIATPIDPVFIVLAVSLASTESKDAYLSCSDYIFSADLNGWLQLQSLLRQSGFSSLLKRIEASMTMVADSMNLGDDETLYRLSHKKICEMLLKKATRLTSRGLPKSMDQRFVQEALDIPTPHVERSEMVESTAQITADSQSISQETVSTEHSASSASTAPTSIDESLSSNTASAAVSQLLRVRTAWEYMLRAYIAKSIHQSLRAALLEQADLDLKPLIEHEKKALAAKQEVQALRTLSDDISRKRPVDDDEAMAKQEEKRRKKEEEEQRKKNVSQGVKKLMKADTSGMKKLSSFFTKKTTK